MSRDLWSGTSPDVPGRVAGPKGRGVEDGPGVHETPGRRLGNEGDKGDGSTGRCVESLGLDEWVEGTGGPESRLQGWRCLSEGTGGTGRGVLPEGRGSLGGRNGTGEDGTDPTRREVGAEPPRPDTERGRPRVSVLSLGPCLGWVRGDPNSTWVESSVSDRTAGVFTRL